MHTHNNTQVKNEQPDEERNDNFSQQLLFRVFYPIPFYPSSSMREKVAIFSCFYLKQLVVSYIKTEAARCYEFHSHPWRMTREALIRSSDFILLYYLEYPPNLAKNLLTEAITGFAYQKMPIPHHKKSNQKAQQQKQGESKATIE